ncbi:MAG: GDSL-type esterase/lipase family protein [Saprospiraceae bacterium]
MKKIFLFFGLLILWVGLPSQNQIPFASDIAQFESEDATNPKPMGQIVFVGSSSFTKWKDVDARFPGFGIINRGFGGSTLVDVIRFAQQTIYKYQPRQVVIYCGENDFAADSTLSVKAVFKRYKTLTKGINKHVPGSQIAFISMKPSPSRIQLIPKYRAANDLIANYNKKKGYQYIHVFDAMLDAAGNPKADIFVSDRLHMNASGYDIWVPIIRPFLMAK